VDHRHPDSFSVAAKAAMELEGVGMRARHRRGIWASAAGSTLARVRGSILRRIQWLRFVAATRRGPQHTGPWARSRSTLGPRVATRDALVALVPGQAMACMARTAWDCDPATMWAADQGSSAERPAPSG
jgi:hypothetical protein